MTTFTFCNGHKVITSDDILHYEDGSLYTEANAKPCVKCGKSWDKEGRDACLGKLPGVKAACCGHGTGEGYIMFDNGITIRGVFKIERSD